MYNGINTETTIRKNRIKHEITHNKVYWTAYLNCALPLLCLRTKLLTRNDFMVLIFVL